MNRKGFILLTLFLFFTAPFLLSAKEPDTFITADEIVVKPGNILQAKGNVTIRRDNVRITAEVMTVNEKTKIIEIKEIKEYFDGNSTKIKAQEARLSEDLSEGIIYATQMLIEDTIRINAKEIEIKNGKIDKVSKIDRVTSCKDCKNGVPLWHFTAGSASNDEESKNIIYRNVTIRVAGRPVGYIPYLRLPNPDVDRAPGFLIPELSITSNLGIGLKLPYFVPIGSSRDILITPFLSSRTKTTQYRYRQKFRNGDVTLSGAISDDEINAGTVRTYYSALGNLKLRYGIDFGIKAGFVNDEKYLRDYSFGSESDLNTTVSLSKVNVDKNRLFNAKLGYVRDKTEEASTDEYYSLTGQYERRLEQNYLPGAIVLYMDGNSSLRIGRGNRISRPPSSAAVGLEYSNSKNIGPFRLTGQSFARLSSFVNSEDTNSLGEELILQYGNSIKFTAPLQKINGGVLKVFKPTVLFSFNGQKGRASGNFFNGPDELSFGNIFSTKKHASLSESELGVSVSTGIEYSVSWENYRHLDFSVGTLWLKDRTYDESYTNGLDLKKPNFLASFGYTNGNSSYLSGKSLLNSEGKVLHNNFESQISMAGIQLDGTYEFVSALSDARLAEDIEYIGFSTSYTGFENFDLSLARRYDLSENSMAHSLSSFAMKFSSGFWTYKLAQNFDSAETDKTKLSAIYDDDCTRLIISFQNVSQAEGTPSSIQSLTVLINLKPFASFSVPNF